MKKLLLIISLLILTGCTASKGEIQSKLAVKNPKGYARLEFHRPSQFISAGINAAVKTNGTKIASVGNGDVEVAFIKPGKHKLVVDYWFSSNESTYTFKPRANRTYKFTIAPRRVHIYPGPSVVPASSTTDKKGNKSGGYFSITPIR